MSRFFAGALAGLLVLLVVLAILVIRGQNSTATGNLQFFGARERGPGGSPFGSENPNGGPAKLADIVSLPSPILVDLNYGERRTFSIRSQRDPMMVALHFSSKTGTPASYELQICVRGAAVECVSKIKDDFKEWLAPIALPLASLGKQDPVEVVVTAICLSREAGCHGSVDQVSWLNYREQKKRGRSMEEQSQNDKKLIPVPAGGGWGLPGFVASITPFVDNHCWWWDPITNSCGQWWPAVCQDGDSDDGWPTRCFAPGKCHYDELVHNNVEATVAFYFPAWVPAYDWNNMEFILDDNGNKIWLFSWYSCTAFLVGPEGLFLTAGHCMHDNQTIANEAEIYFNADTPCDDDPFICNYGASFNMYKCFHCDVNGLFSNFVNDGNWNNDPLSHINATQTSGVCILHNDGQTDHNLLQLIRPNNAIINQLQTSPNFPMQVTPWWYYPPRYAMIGIIHHLGGYPKKVQVFDNRYHGVDHGTTGRLTIRARFLNPSAWCCPSDWFDPATWGSWNGLVKHTFGYHGDTQGGSSGAPVYLESRRGIWWWWCVASPALCKRATDHGLWRQKATPAETDQINALSAADIARYQAEFNAYEASRIQEMQKQQDFDANVWPGFVGGLDANSQSLAGKIPTYDQRLNYYLEHSGGLKDESPLYIESESQEYLESTDYLDQLDAKERDRIDRQGPFSAFVGRATGVHVTSGKCNGEGSAESSAMRFILPKIIDSGVATVNQQGYIVTANYDPKNPVYTCRPKVTPATAMPGPAQI